MGQLEMNQPVSDQSSVSSSPIGYNQSPEEKEAIKLVNKCFEEAKRARRRYDYRWGDWYRFWRGRQWKEQRPSYRHSEVINLVWRSIQSTVPIQTDAKPRIEFLPTEPSDRPFAEVMNKLIESDWESQNWLYQLTETVYDASIYGTGLGSVMPPKKEGGRIVYDVQDPWYFYPDPDAIDVNKKCKYVVIAEPVTLSKLKAEYPKQAPYLKSDLSDADKAKHQYDDVDDQYKSTINDRSLNDGPTPGNAKEPEKCLKITLYIMDEAYTEELQKETDPGTGESKDVYVQKLKYPGGRKICIASGMVLHDGPMGLDDERFPYARLVNYIDPRQFWGISDVEPVESIQKIFNKLVSYALDVLTLMGNPIWKIPTSAGIDTDNLFNRPGLILEYEGDRAPQREEGVQLQPYVMNLITMMGNAFDDISGDADVSRGAKPDGVTAASAISQLQESAKTRIRLKVRNMDAYLQDFGQMYCARVLQFYTAPQVFRITNDQNAQEFFKFYVEQLPDGSKQGVLRQINEYGQESEAKYIPVKNLLDVKVSTGSSLPFAKDDRVSLANAAFDRGAIDQEELLKAYDYPNYQAVIERMNQKAQMQAQMQAEQQQQSQGAPTNA